ncbi:MAG: Crp/Fnr family transcriptional regulator [Wolinella sp.]
MTIQDLRTIEAFASLGEDELTRLIPFCKIRHHSKGEILHYEDDNIESVGFLIGGTIKLYKVDRFDNEIFLYLAKRGSLVTSLSLVNTIKCFSNVECMSDCTMLYIELDSLKALLMSSIEILLAITNEIIKQKEELEYIINRELVFDGTAKVAHMLHLQINEFNTLKKQDIAYMLNIQPETLSRILKKLHRDGVICTDEKGQIKVLNNIRLIEIYQ